MRKGDKRGLSTVVATLLIILLVIVAVGIVWAVIKSVIKNSSEQISLGKFTIDLEIVAVYPSDGVSDTGIKVRRNPGEGDLEGIIFSIFDGENTHVYEKHNITLNELEVKTFFVDYQGNIVSVSVYPILLGSSGNPQTGGISDTYYYTGENNGGGYISPGCTPDCAGKTLCEDNGCGGNCGLDCSGSTPYCINGACESDTGGLTPNCSCAEDICIGTTCDDGLGGSCFGQLTLEQDCGSLMCGESPNGCGSCGTCESGYECNGGICSPTCLASDCGSRECGGIPGRPECGDTICGICDVGAGETCNVTTGTCFVCQPDCNGKECGPDGCGGSCGDCSVAPFNSSYICNASQLCEMCTPDCNALGKECGPVPNGCGLSCGNCTELYGYPEDSCSDGICIPPEELLNSGDVLSVWPVPIGHNFLTGDNLPGYDASGDTYNLSNANYIRITSLYSRCYQIIKLDYPVNAGQYTVIQVSTGSTDIQVGDHYELWETLEGCNH